MNESKPQQKPETKDQPGDDVGFSDLAQEEQIGFFAELWEFIKENKLWWMSPLIVALLLMGLLVILGSTGAAPFIYTLF